MHSSDEEQIVLQIRDGDEVAFGRLFEEYQPRLFRFIWHMVRSEAAANDLVQNIFLKIWRGRQRWRPGNSLQGYLYRAAKNSALNYLRDSKSDRREEITEKHMAVGDPATDLEEKETSRAIQECIDALPPGCRSVFVMSRYEESKYKEIAETLEISIKTVETQMGRALRRLRGCLQSFL